MAISSTFVTGQVFTAADANLMANSGLVYVKSATIGTGVSSVTVTNAFSSTYDNYLVVASGGTMTVGTAIKLQLGAASTGYYGTLMYGLYTGGALINASDNNNSVFSYVGGGGTDNYTMAVQLFSPYLAKTTRIGSSAVHWVSNFGSYNGVQTNATSFTDFTFAPISGTMTGGTVLVYGYRKA